MKITYKLTNDDIQNYISTNFETNKFNSRKIILILGIVIFSFIGLVFLSISDYFEGVLMFALVIFYFYLLFGLPKRAKKKYINSLKSSGYLDETKVIEVNENEFKFETPSKTSIYHCSNISNISVIKDNFVLINFKHEDSLLIPTSAFSSKDEMVDFINTIKSNAKIL